MLVLPADRAGPGWLELVSPGGSEFLVIAGVQAEAGQGVLCPPV